MVNHLNFWVLRRRAQGKEPRRRRWKGERINFFEVFVLPKRPGKMEIIFPRIISKKLFFLKLDRSNLHYKTRLKMAPDSQKVISKIGQKLSDQKNI